MLDLKRFKVSYILSTILMGILLFSGMSLGSSLASYRPEGMLKKEDRFTIQVNHYTGSRPELLSLKYILQKNKKYLIGNVKAILPDGNGGFYVGGEFVFSGIKEPLFVAHVDNNGEINKNFFVNTNGLVSTMALSTEKNILFIGGRFLSVGGLARERLAAIDLISGSVIPNFQLSVDGEIYSMELTRSSQTLYIGGKFTSVGGVSRLRLAAIDTTMGNVTAFHPVMNDIVYALALHEESQTLFVGGAFTEVGNGVKRNYLVAVDFITGDFERLDLNQKLTQAVKSLRLINDNLRVNLTDAYIDFNW